MKNSASKSRSMVLDILTEHERSGRKYNELIRAVFAKYSELSRQDKAFIRRLSSGVIERSITLDHVIDCYASTKTKKQKPLIRNILRMGVYQLLYMDAVPASAAVNEAVSLACDRGFKGLRGFVNGVLRSVERNKAAIVWPGRDKDVAGYLSVYYSMPRWIVEKLLEECGEELCEKQLAAYLRQRPISVQVIRDEEELLDQWGRQGIRITPNPWLAHMYFLENVPGIEELYGFCEGCFFVQDTASALAVYAAGIMPGEHVLDICAAPGGKSMLAATLCDGVVSCDISEDKLSLIEENAKRLKLTNITPKLSDARCENAELYGSADVLIADLPCSGLGVMGRKADIRYRLKPEDIDSLAALQKEILRCCIGYLKPGGRLLYSTCTVSSQENAQMREWIIRELGLKPLDISGRIPRMLIREGLATGELKLYCGEPEQEPLLDGFYLALFERREP